MMEAIDYEKMYKNMRSRASLESKAIKKMMFYNYLNDNIPSVVIDCRKDYEQNKKIENGVLGLINSFHISNFSALGVTIKSGFRLILILEDTQDLKTSEELEKIRLYIKEEDKIEKGVYFIIRRKIRKLEKLILYKMSDLKKRKRYVLGRSNFSDNSEKDKNIPLS